MISLPILAAALASAQTLKLDVDASRINDLIVRTHITIPVKPGASALAFPKWIPGEHGPSGPIANMIGMKIAANDKPIPWKRSETDMFRFEFQTQAPTVEVDLTFGFATDTIASAKLARLIWNQVLVYPADADADALTVQASLTVPKGWKVATALTPSGTTGDTTTYHPSSLTTLIDSPCVTGQYFESVNLTSDIAIPHVLAVAADRPEDIILDDATILGYRRLVQEAWALFGDRGYRRYQWLMSLSDHGAESGLEHHESSEDGMKADSLRTDAGKRAWAELNAHEYVHSWNGKYRRPAGLIGKNYQEPMKTSLLWMYEGMTQFWGSVLPARAGFWSPEFFRETVAMIAADLERQQGRTWRPLADTATCAQILYRSPPAWTMARRDVAFYYEMVLNWLEADMMIRKATNGAKNLDDFCKSFHGGANGVPQVKPYELEGILSGLSAVAPLDWRGWVEKRVYDVAPHVNTAGIEASGWKLVYSDVPNLAELDRAEINKDVAWTHSIGLVMTEDKVDDVAPGLPAEQAGIVPSMKLVSINGEAYSVDAMDRAITKAMKTGKIELVIERAGFLKNLTVNYKDGHKFPHLVPIEGKPDLLSDLIRPHVARGKD